ncbi:FAS1 domain-containing protein [Syncephalis fuscata]|nr:FAS1 domain-containing protein [Syncephalis fuscata]
MFKLHIHSMLRHLKIKNMLKLIVLYQLLAVFMYSLAFAKPQIEATAQANAAAQAGTGPQATTMTRTETTAQTKVGPQTGAEPQVKTTTQANATAQTRTTPQNEVKRNSLPGSYPPLSLMPGFELSENKTYSNLTIMDVLSNVQNLSNFAKIINTSSMFKKYLSNKAQRCTIFVPVNSKFQLADSWEERAKTKEGQGYLEHMLAYHLISDHSYDFGRWSSYTQSFVPTAALDTNNDPKSLLVYMGSKRMQVNCAVVVASTINVNNGIIYVIDQLLDPWLETPIVKGFSKNGEGITCKQLSEKVKF